MSSTKTLVLLALLAVAALANSSLRLKRAPEPQTEAIGEFPARQDGTTAELSPGDDTPAQFEEEASGEAEHEHHEEHHEHHDMPEGSGESPVESVSVAAEKEPEADTEAAPMSSEEPKMEETTETAVLSKEPEADEKPIGAATVVSAAEDQPSTSEAPIASSEEPATSSESPVSSATSFVSSLFVLVCVYLIAM